MSLKSWKKIYYPVPAKKVSKRNAIAHSLRKWQGLFRSILREHGLRRDGVDIVGCKGEGTTFGVGADNCALCARYISTVSDEHRRCAECPLLEFTGEGCRDGQWTAFSLCGNPRPMIKALKKALAAQQKEK